MEEVKNTASADPMMETEEEQLRRKREEYNKQMETDDIIFTANVVLYRYDITAKQWAGRGKGKIRVSFEPKNRRYRITQIREKVFKLGCNHYIEESTNLEKYSLVEHAWIWTTYGDNCGDNLGATQKYLARFSSEEDANGFNKAVEKGKKAIASEKSDKEDSKETEDSKEEESSKETEDSKEEESSKESSKEA